MIIHLNEIPPEGKTYHFDRSTGELNEELKSLIRTNEFQMDFSILPAGPSYTLQGQFHGSIPLVCSLCASEFELPVHEKYREILMFEDNQSAKNLKVEEEMIEQTDVSLLTSPHYDVGRFAQEIIMLAEPVQPICKPDCQGLCFNCGTDLNAEQCQCAEKKKSLDSPFSVLKKLKLN